MAPSPMQSSHVEEGKANHFSATADAESIRITVSPFHGELTLDLALNSQLSLSTYSHARRCFASTLNSPKLSHRRLRNGSCGSSPRNSRHKAVLRSDSFGLDGSISIPTAHSPPHSPILLLSPKGSRQTSPRSQRQNPSPREFTSGQASAPCRRLESCFDIVPHRCADDGCEHAVNPDVPGKGSRGSLTDTNLLPCTSDAPLRQTPADEAGILDVLDNKTSSEVDGGFWTSTENALTALLGAVRKPHDDTNASALDAFLGHDARQQKFDDEEKEVPQEDATTTELDVVSDLHFLRAQLAAAREEALLTELQALVAENARLRSIVSKYESGDSSGCSSACADESRAAETQGSGSTNSCSRVACAALRSKITALERQEAEKAAAVRTLQARLDVAMDQRRQTFSELWLTTAALQSGLAGMGRVMQGMAEEARAEGAGRGARGRREGASGRREGAQGAPQVSATRERSGEAAGRSCKPRAPVNTLEPRAQEPQEGAASARCEAAEAAGGPGADRGEEEPAAGHKAAGCEAPASPPQSWERPKPSQLSLPSETAGNYAAAHSTAGNYDAAQSVQSGPRSPMQTRMRYC